MDLFQHHVLSLGNRRPRRGQRLRLRALPLQLIRLPSPVEPLRAYYAVPSRLQLGSDGDAQAEDDRSGAGVGVLAEEHRQSKNILRASSSRSSALRTT